MDTPTLNRWKQLKPWHTRPNHIELARKGGYNARAVYMRNPVWKRQAKSARAALARWHPDDPALKIPWQDFKTAYYLAYKAGYQRGAGW